MDKKKNISIFGAFSGNNRGDVAILETILDNVSPLSNRIYIGSKNPKKLGETLKHNNIKIFKSFTNYIGISSIINISKSDIIIVGGGGLFFEREFWNVFFNHLINIFFVVLVAKILGKKVHIFCVGVEKIQKKVPKFLVRYILKNSDTITVRDENSKKIFQNIFPSNKYIVFLDPVLSTKCKINKKTKNTILIILNGSTKEEDILNLISKLDGYDVTLYENEYSQEFVKNFIANNNLEKQIETIEKNNFPTKKSINFVGSFDLVISTPMHGCIFAYVTETPFISINWNEKVKSFIELTGETFQIKENFSEIGIKDIESSMKMTFNKDKHSEIQKKSQEGIDFFVDTYL